MNKITSRENPLVKQVAALGKDAALRRELGLFVCESPVLLREAAACGAPIDKVFALDPDALNDVTLDGAALYQVNESVMEKLSGLKTPPGVLFTCRMAGKGVFRPGRVLAVEDLADPGNLGTVIRTAEAFSMDTVALVGRCADVYAPKVVRATMGSILRVNLCFMTLEELAQACSDSDLPLYAAALTDKAVSIGDVDLSRAAVLIGNEARGLSQAALDICGKHVIIPITGIQSLNAAVAASVFMYEMAKKS